ncbi:cyclic GMP-AMP synthase-like receptor [Cloeon dipterum]|uniref:cyclic GMP-AMP synthase-like receptor n=1 Tax=Cloeon dipterum TaxID=197152 RepID=UPI00321FA4EE
MEGQCRSQQEAGSMHFIFSKRSYFTALLLLAALELPAPADAKRNLEKGEKHHGLSPLCKVETHEVLICDIMGNTAAAPAEVQQAPALPDIGKLEISRKKYPGTIVQVLENVNGQLKLKEDEIKNTNRLIDELVKKDLIEGLKKKSKAFELIYQKIVWTGSSYEGLKISHPDEFDLNIVLRFPFKSDLIKISPRNDVPGFVTIKNFKKALDTIEADPKWRPAYTELLKWADDSGNLLTNKVREWMESIVVKFSNEYNVGKPENKKIIVRKSGPAMTLWLGKLSIDVVPVFGFTSPPPSPIRVPKPMNREWFIVPKPLKGQTDIKDAWRVSFYEFEKDILRDYGTIKPAIKLIKKLRDTQDWKSLYSYAIKSAALWMKEEGGISGNEKIDITFLKLLKGIQTYLDKGFLPFYWEKRANMLRMNDVERKNLANRIARLIIKIEENWVSNPSYIGELICKL